MPDALRSAPLPDVPRLTALTMTEGLCLAYAAAALRSIGIFKAMNTQVTAMALARQHRIDTEMLRGALDYLAARTDIVVASGDGNT